MYYLYINYLNDFRVQQKRNVIKIFRMKLYFNLRFFLTFASFYCVSQFRVTKKGNKKIITCSHLSFSDKCFRVTFSRNPKSISKCLFHVRFTKDKLLDVMYHHHHHHLRETLCDIHLPLYWVHCEERQHAAKRNINVSQIFHVI